MKQKILIPATVLSRRVLLLLLLLLPFLGWGQSTTVVISQVYGAGGNAFATYMNDFVELYNKSAAPVNVTGWTIQYAAGNNTGPLTVVATLPSATIEAGHYYLIQFASNAAVGAALPTPDFSGAQNLAATAGQVGLANNSTPITPGGSSAPFTFPANKVDFVGYGTTAVRFEGTGAAPAPTNTTKSDIRNASNDDTDVNSTDFTSSTVTPRNSGRATVSTASPSAVAPTTATEGGTTGGTGVPAVTGRGIAYSTVANPQIGGAGVTQVAESPLTAPATFSVNLTGLTPGTTYFAAAYVTNSNGTAYGADQTFTTPTGPPSLTASPTTLSLNTTAKNTPSSSKTFTLTGSNLGATVIVTAPVGFELATASNNFVAGTTTLSLATTNGSISRAVFVRLGATNSGTFSGTVTSSSGTASAGVAVSGTVIAAPAMVQPTVTVSNATFNTVDFTLSGGNGQKRLLVLRTPSASTTTVPKDQTTYTASTVRGANNSYGPGVYVIVADGTTTSGTITALSSNQAYVLSAYSYNDDGVAGLENYLTASPGTASFTTTPTPVSYYANATGLLNDPNTFGTNPDGSGAHPANFSANDKVYQVGGTNRTISADWTVTGTNSKVVLFTSASFTVPTTSAFSGTIDLLNNAYLTVLNSNTSGIAFGDLAQSSTVEFAQATGTYVVPAPPLGYGNLKLSNATKQFSLGPVIVGGNLSFENVTNVGGITTSSSSVSMVVLAGNLSLVNTTFNAAANQRITLRLNSGTPQTLTGNGNLLRLFRLATFSSGGGGILSDANGGTPVQVGSSALGSGVDLASGSTLVLNSNTLSFTPGGTAALTNIGTFTLSSTSSLDLENTLAPIGTLNITPGSSTIGNLRVATQPGDYLALSQSLTINGLLNLDVAGTLDIGANQTLTLNGAVIGTGALRGSAISDLVIGGNGGSSNFGTLYLLQPAPGSLLRNFTLNRTTIGTILLGSPATVNGVLTLTNGFLTTTATNLLTLATTATVSGGSSASFVNGPLAYVTSGAVTAVFPIGKGIAYRPLTLNIASQSNTRTYTAEQFNSTAGTTAINGPGSGAATAASPLTRVSNIRYFNVTPDVTTGTFSGTITLSFAADDYANYPADASFVIAKRADRNSPWGNYGRSSNTGIPNSGQPVAGTLTSDVFTSFSDFALASTAPTGVNALTTLNPLPVELVEFTAQRQAQTAVAVKWATASEKNSAYFEVQRSLNGLDFATIATVAAQGSSTRTSSYAALDKTAPAGLLYYRLRQADRDGTVAFSPVVTVAGAGVATKVLLYPNPTRATVSFIAETATPYRVLNQLGQALLYGTVEPGTASVAVEALPVGLYFLELHTATGRVVQKFEKQ